MTDTNTIPLIPRGKPLPKTFPCKLCHKPRKVYNAHELCKDCQREVALIDWNCNLFVRTGQSMAARSRAGLIPVGQGCYERKARMGGCE